MNPTNTIKLTLTAITLTLILNGCGGSGGAKEDNNTHKSTKITSNTINKQNTNSKDAKVNLTIIQTATVKNLELKVDKLSLNKNTTTKLELTPTLSKGKVTQKLKDAIANPKFIVTPNDAVKIDSKTKTITALKDTNVTIQAKIANTLSNKIKLNIYWEVNGHRLPPEPDPKINNSTLLGIDSNNNGVRDDVERYIAKTYGKEEITLQIGFQVAKAFNAVIEHPENAEEVSKSMDDAFVCESYFRNDADEFGDPILIKERIMTSKIFKSIMLNTEPRIRAYLIYNRNMSGTIWTSVHADKEKEKCTFDVDKLLKDRK